MTLKALIVFADGKSEERIIEEKDQDFEMVRCRLDQADSLPATSATLYERVIFDKESGQDGGHPEFDFVYTERKFD